jgi:2-oxoglutarate ferredoxin oxidoreductase subunit gamma
MIGSPVIRNPDMLVVMNNDSYRRFGEKLSPGGILIYDSSQIPSATPRNGIRLVAIAAGAIASSMNNASLANMALLGASIAASGIVDIKSLLSALDEVTPVRRRELLEVNRNILMKGYEGLHVSN